MCKSSRNVSTVISIAISLILAVTFLAVMVFIPVFSEKVPIFAEIKNLFHSKNLFGTGSAFYYIFVYALSVIAEICIIAVLFLLFRVRKGLVFSKTTVSLVRFVSWGSFAMGLIFLLAQYFHPLSILFALAFFFLGLCLRVVKNAFEEAIAIKSENDLTV